MLAPFSKALLTSQPKSNQPISAVVLFLPPPQFGLLPQALDLLQHLLGARLFNRLLFGMVEVLRVQVVATLAFRFLFFNGIPMFVGVSVLADASHLPRYFHAWPAGFDCEAIAADLTRDDGLSGLATSNIFCRVNRRRRSRICGKPDWRTYTCDEYSLEAVPPRGCGNESPRCL